MITTPIIVEQSFQVSAAKLWRAITEHDKMIQWFFKEIPVFEAKEGFQTQFNVATEERNFLHLWKIMEVVPEKKIVYDWKYEGYSGTSIAAFEIVDNTENSRLIVTHSGIESFPQAIPEFRRESCQGGWDYFIGESLKNYLA